MNTSTSTQRLGAAKQPMTISELRADYLAGKQTPESLIADIHARAAEVSHYNIWIHLLTNSEIQIYLDALQHKPIETHPLWGIPFAIKDNIDLAHIPTTAGCEAFAYTPTQSAKVVQQLIDAGAIPVGKTNLDQFATGLNGTRSPIGPCHNSFDPAYVSGGSSSGSSVAVGLGLATFSLGTDTAGSGRVPACFNNLIGLKPSVGLLSATGMVPVCRSLDCMTVFAYNTDDANTVLSVAEGFDLTDGYSRANPYSNQTRQYGLRSGPLKVGIIPKEQLNFFGSDAYEKAYFDTINTLSSNGFELIEIDYAPFDEAAKLLYEGPWVTERYLAAQPIIDEQPEQVFPVVRQIIEQGRQPKATDLFSAEYRLHDLKQVCYAQLNALDCLLTPTAGRHFTIEEMLAEPILHNSQLGYYTNFMNLLDMASIAVPTQFTADGMPFGITLVGAALSDRALLSIANRVQQKFPLPTGAFNCPQPALKQSSVADSRVINVMVCGAHLSGQPLNWQLTERGAVLLEATTTSPNYKMVALAGGPPLRPGLIYTDSNDGAAIEVEIWAMPSEQFGSFVAGIPEPLGIGKVELLDGRRVAGFICEPIGTQGATDITHFGGWRAYLASL